MTSINRQNSFFSEPKLAIEANIEGRIQRIEIPQYALRFCIQVFLLLNFLKAIFFF
jgi:hypothetical protein